MEQKDRLTLLEYLCAFSLLAFVIRLFGNTLAGYNLFLVIFLAAGFIYSWFNRRAGGLWSKILVTLGVIGIFAWMVYSVLNSSLYYKEVILLCIKAALLLEAVVSFEASNPAFLAQMEALTIPLCMAFPLFSPSYAPHIFICMGGYAFSWLVLLRVKFYGRFTTPQKVRLLKNQANLFAASILATAALGAWALYSMIPLDTLKMRGLFQEKSKTGIDISPELWEKDYYGFQEKINKMIVDRHIPGLPASEERHEAIEFLDALIRELPDTFEVDRAEQGLLSQFKLPGPGLEKDIGENITLLNKYVEIKSEVNVYRLKENIVDIFKGNPFDIKRRLAVLEQTGKMQSASSFKEARKNKERLKETISQSSLEDGVKGQAHALLRHLRSWKDFELYRKKRRELNEKIAGFKEDNWRSELARLMAAIEQMLKVAEFLEIREKIINLEAEAPADIKATLDDLKEMLYVKLAMLLDKDAKELKVSVEKQKLTGERLIGFEDTIDTLVASRLPPELSESYNSLQQRSRLDKIRVSKDNRELAGVKTETLLEEERSGVKDILQVNTPPDLSDNFLKELQRAEDDEQEPEVRADFQYLNGYTEEFSASGFIRGAHKKEFSEAMERLKELYIFRLKLNKQPEIEEPPLEIEEEKQKEQLQENKVEKQEMPQQPRQEKKLLEIMVLPEYLELALGLERQFVAIGRYSDGSQEDLTAKAEWQCSDEQVARVTSGNASALAVGEVKITAESEKIESRPATLVVKEAALLAIVIPFKEIKLPLWGEFALKADGYYTDHSEKDITSLVTWRVSSVPVRRAPIVKVEGTKIIGLRLGKAKISAEYLGISSPEKDVQVILTFAVCLVFFCLFLLYLILLAALLFGVFFILTRRREKRIIALCRQDPKKAILLIYENALEVLVLFQPRSKEFLPPFAFARGVENNFGIKDGVFLELSAKYAEAKYSRHALSPAAAQEAARLQNSFVGCLANRQGRLKSFCQKALCLLKRRPFFIHI